MSILLDIQKQLDRASERVARLERSLRDNPGFPSIAANLDTAVRIQTQLQMQFDEAAATIGIDVFKYRAFNDTDRTEAGPAFGAISAFQRLVSVVFGSLKYHRKQRAAISRELAAETAFGFGYAFGGSVGVVLTVPSDSDLFRESFLDESIKLIFEMAKVNDAKAMQVYADRLGPGSINALREWAEGNADNGLGADIEWRRGASVKDSLFLQRQQLSAIRTAIDQTSSEEQNSLDVVGVLLGADIALKTFHIQLENGTEIKGSVEPGAIDRKHEAVLPRKYKARIIRTTKKQFATGSIETHNHLIGLVEIEAQGVGDEPEETG
jgi:hypothetical protein